MLADINKKFINNKNIDFDGFKKKDITVCNPLYQLPESIEPIIGEARRLAYDLLSDILFEKFGF